jgi:hypothetical protein
MVIVHSYVSLPEGNPSAISKGLPPLPPTPEKWQINHLLGWAIKTVHLLRKCKCELWTLIVPRQRYFSNRETETEWLSGLVVQPQHLVHCFIDSLILWFIYSSGHYFTRSWIALLLHWFTDILVSWLFDSSLDASMKIALFFHRFTDSSVHWFINSLGHWFIQSTVRMHTKLFLTSWLKALGTLHAGAESTCT